MCSGSAWQRAQVPGAERVYRRLGVPNLPDIVHAVAVCAIGHARVPSGQALAVDAGPVLRKLVYALLRLIPVNPVSVGVAAGAAGGHRTPVDLTHKSTRAAHGLFDVVARRITAVAVGAREAVLPVNILLEELCRSG